MNNEVRRVKHKSLLPVYLAGLVSKKYTLKQAAESTGYNEKYLSQLKQRYLIEGFNCLDHGNKGRKPVNRKSQEFRDLILKKYASDTYKDCNFRYFCSCLNKYEKIEISLSTLRVIMQEAGIKSPEARKIKKPKIHRTRIRRECMGDLLQLDGTPYPWFYKFGNKKSYCICGAVDDATSAITGLYMTENECLYNYAEVMRDIINNFGVPRETYTDRAAIFCVTPKNKQNLTVWEQLAGIHDKKTQWQRILDELHINQILAWSPEAKGRVERMWRTLQGRLPTEFYINKIDTVEKANAFLKTYIEEYNNEFAVEPARSDNYFLEFSDERKTLDDILCARIPRYTDSHGCFSFHAYKFAVLDCPRVRNRLLDVCISEKGLYVQFENENVYYATKCLDMPMSGESEKMPQCVIDIIFRYLYANQKEVSA